MALRDVEFGPVGVGFNGGLSYLWAAGATGTAAHGVNASIVLSYRGTVIT